MFDVVTNTVLTEEKFSITNEDIINRIDRGKKFSLSFFQNFYSKETIRIHLFIYTRDWIANLQADVATLLALMR